MFRNPRYSAASHANAAPDMSGWNKVTIQVPKRPRFEVNAGQESQPRTAPKVVVARAESSRIVVSRPAKNVTIISRAH